MPVAEHGIICLDCHTEIVRAEDVDQLTIGQTIICEVCATPYNVLQVWPPRIQHQDTLFNQDEDDEDMLEDDDFDEDEYFEDEDGEPEENLI